MPNATPPIRAIDLAAKVRFRDGAQQFLDESLTPREFLALLVERENYRDAIRFLPHALPKRAAVWWGCLCAWHAFDARPTEVAEAALATTLRWVQNPTDENRYAARQIARAADRKTVAGTLAMAVFFSGGSLLPPHLPKVPPKPHLTAQLVAVAVHLASVSFPHHRFSAVRRQFLQLGIEVAEQRNLWLPAFAREERVPTAGDSLESLGRPQAKSPGRKQRRSVAAT